MTTRAPFYAPTPAERIALREAEYLGQSRRSRSKDHKAVMARRAQAASRQQRLEALSDDKAARRSFRHFERTMLRDGRIWKPVKLRLERQTPLGRPKKSNAEKRVRRHLPSIGFDIVDSKGRFGVFLSARYDGAKTTDRGVFRRRIEYAVLSRDVVIDADGRTLFVSNVARDPDEAVALADEIEAFARAERLNGKVCFNLVIGYPRPATARQREMILRRFCQRTFADEGLPFMALNHEPKRAGKVHNPHGHITASLRPVHREAPYRYLISKDLRVDLDGEDGMARMRRILAEVTTQVMREAGFEHQYTHLSNAARGLALIPQEGLTKDQSEAAIRGETVAANERNKVLADRARAYVLARIKKTVEASKAPLLAKLPWAITRAPQLAKSGLRAVVPKRMSTLLGLRPRGELVRVQLTKTLPATAPVRVLTGPRGSANQVPLLDLSRLREIPPSAPAKTRCDIVMPFNGLPFSNPLAGVVHRVDHPVAAKAKLVGTSAVKVPAALPSVQSPQHGSTAQLVIHPVRELPVGLVPGRFLMAADRPLVMPPAPPTQTLAKAWLPVRCTAFASLTLPIKANASVLGSVPLLGQNLPISRLDSEASPSMTKLVRAPGFVATDKLQGALPQFPQASLVHGLRPASGGASIIALPPAIARKVPPISWSKQQGVAQLIVPPRLAPTTLVNRSSEDPIAPLVRLPARTIVGMVQPISALSKVPPLRQLIAAPPAPMALPRGACLARKATLVPAIMPAQLLPGLVRPSPVARAALPRLVGKSPLVELPPRHSVDEFDWLRAKVDAMRTELAAAQPPQPSRMCVEKEKSEQRPPSTPTVAAPGNSQLDHLCRDFLLAKTNEDRRIAAVQIRKNKAAVEAMNRDADPLWIAEQKRFRTQQSGVGTFRSGIAE